MKEEIQNCLKYCQQQNGLPYCKNCGLTQEMIDSFKKAVGEEVTAENENMNLKERLKFWHIRCLNCDCLAKRIDKEKKINEIFTCSDCGEKIKVLIGQENISINELVSLSQVVMIGCRFHGEQRLKYAR